MEDIILKVDHIEEFIQLAKELDVEEDEAVEYWNEYWSNYH